MAAKSRFLLTARLRGKGVPHTESSLISRRVDSVIGDETRKQPLSGLLAILGRLEDEQTSNNDNDNNIPRQRDDLELLCEAILQRKTNEQEVTDTIPSTKSVTLSSHVDAITNTEPTTSELEVMKRRIKQMLFKSKKGDRYDESLGRNVIKTIEKIAQDGKKAICYGYAEAISIAITLRLLKTATAILTNAASRDIYLPINVYTRLMSVLSRRGQITKTLTVFRLLCSKSKPNNESIAIIVLAINRSPQPHNTTHLFGYARPTSLKLFLSSWQAGVIPDINSFSALICGSGSLKVGLELARTAVFTARLNPSELMYMSLLSLCVVEKRMSSAKRIIACAEASGMAVTESFWIQALRVHAEAPSEAIALFDKIKKILPHPPTEPCYVVLLRCLQRHASQVGDFFVLHAEHLYREAFSSCHRPPLQLHTELAEVYRRTGDYTAVDTLRDIVGMSASRAPPGFAKKMRQIDAGRINRRNG